MKLPNSDSGPMLLLWYAMAPVTIVLPMFIFTASRLIHAARRDDEDPERQRYRYYQSSQRQQSGQNRCRWWQFDCTEYTTSYYPSGYNYNANQNNGYSQNQAYNNAYNQNWRQNNYGYGNYNNNGYNNYNNYNNYNGYNNYNMNNGYYNNRYGNMNWEEYQRMQEERPWWWLWAADERRDEDQVNPTMVIVYVWMVILFIAIVVYGRNVLRQNGDTEGLTASLVIFGNISFLGMLYMGSLGAVQDDGRVVEMYGFYGEFSVMHFLSCLCWTVYSVIFAAWLLVRARRHRKMADSDSKTLSDEPDHENVDKPSVYSNP